MPEDPSPAASLPKRVLGPIDATSVVVGAIIGVGIFFTPSSVARLVDSGGYALLAWALGGVIAMCGALTFAELGSRYNGVGAQYQILRDAHGPLIAFLFVFCNSTAIQAGAVGIISLICAENLVVAAGIGPLSGIGVLSVAINLILFLMAANIIGVKWGAAVQNFTVFTKVATLLAVAGLAVYARFGDVAPPTAAAAPVAAARVGGFAGVLAALVPAFFSYGGWQHALWISGEVKEPRRNLPRAIIIGVALVITVYLLANWAYLSLLGHAGVAAATTLAADAVARVTGDWGRRAIAAAVGLSALGVLNAQFLSGPRLVQSMASDGRFFAPLRRLSPRFGTPVGAIVMLGAIAIAMLLAVGREGVDKLLNGAVAIDGVFFVLTGIALMVLRRRQAENEGFSVPWYPLVPLVFVIGEFGVVAGAFQDREVRGAAYIGACWIAGAAILYAVCFRRR